MALGRTLKSFPFTQGVDTKTDAYLAVKPARVENRVVRGGSLQRRYGTTKLSSLLDTGGSLTKGEALFAFDGELVRLNGGQVYSLAQQQGNWTTRVPNIWTAKGLSSIPTLTHSTQRIVRTSTNQVDADHATAEGVTVTAWVDTQTAKVYVKTYDEATGEVYAQGDVFSPVNSVGCRCVALGSKVLVFSCVPQTSISVAVVDVTQPETIPVSAVIESDLAGLGDCSSFDAVAYPAGNYAIVTYVKTVTAAPHIFLLAVGPTGAVLSSPAKTDMGACHAQTGGGNNQQLYVKPDSNGALYVLNTGADVYYLPVTVTSSFTAAAFVSVKTALTTTRCSMVEVSTGLMGVFASTINNGGPSLQVQYGTLNSAGVVGTMTGLAYTMGQVLVSDGFLVNGLPCALVANPAQSGSGTSSQPTAWVMAAYYSIGTVVAGMPLAKILPGLSGIPTGARLHRPFTSSAGATALLVAEQGPTSYTSASGVIISTTPLGVTRANVLPTSAGQLPALRFGQAVYVGGSVPRIYDGLNFVEAGHNLFPEYVTPVAATGSNLSVGTYGYRVVYTWLNARGERQRSVPSPAASVTISAGANQAAQLTIPCQSLTGRDLFSPLLPATQIEVYRTTANGNVYYRCSSVTAPTYTTYATATVNFNDTTVTDAALVANELLYTTGGVNDNVAPPAYRLACSHKQRLCIAGLDNAYQWRSSNQPIAGEMLRFNESWGGRVPEATGPITALASMDGNLFIFTSQACYLVPGDGPDLFGNNNWVAPQVVTSVDAGALSQAGTVSTPFGILVQTVRGWHLLGRDLSFQYVGADVEAYGTLTARCATLRPETEEVWLQCDAGSDLPGGQQGTLVPGNGGVCLVYNYHYGQWSVLTNYGAQSACYYQGKYTRVRSDGLVLQEQPGTFTDSGVPYSTLVETGWLKPAELLQGYARVWRASVLGTYGSDCTLTWDIAYDYSPTYSAGDTTVVSGSGVYTPGGPFQLRRHLRVQKCEALKMRFTDSGASGTCQGIGLTALELELGFYGKLYPLPSSQST